jgi:AraC-like DNA-binding protein
MSPREPMLRSQLVRPALHAVRATGCDPSALVVEFELPATAMDDAETVLPLATMEMFFDRAAELAGDPWLGVTLAHQLERGTFGLVEYAVLSAPTVGDALQRLVRYMTLLNEVVSLELRRRGTAVVLEQRVPGRPRCLGRHPNEFFVAFVLKHIRALTHGRVRAQRAWLAHRPPGSAAALARKLGVVRVDVDRGSNGVELPAAHMRLELASAEPPLLALLDRQAEHELALRASPDRLVGQVRAQIHAGLARGGTSIADVARSVARSSRSLQRRLAAEGTSFHALVDDVRGELARVYVREGNRPLGEIAFVLGFSQLSAFLRAFKRWTGQTPTQYRARGT